MKKCLCFTLRKGGLIIGMLQIKGAILGAIFWLAFVFAILPYSLTKITEAQNNIKAHNTRVETANNISKIDGNATVSSNIDIMKQQEIMLDEIHHKLIKAQHLHKYLTPVFLVHCVLALIFGSILIHGIRQKSTRLIKIWIIYQTATTVMSVCISIGYYWHAGISASIVDIVQIIFAFVLVPAVSGFAIKVVSDLSKQMQQQPMVKPYNSLPIR